MRDNDGGKKQQKINREFMGVKELSEKIMIVVGCFDIGFDLF